MCEPEILKQMDGLSSFLTDNHADIGTILSFSDFIKRLNQVMHKDIQPEAAGTEMFGSGTNAAKSGSNGADTDSGGTDSFLPKQIPNPRQAVSLRITEMIPRQHLRKRAASFLIAEPIREPAVSLQTAEKPPKQRAQETGSGSGRFFSTGCSKRDGWSILCCAVPRENADRR